MRASLGTFIVAGVCAALIAVVGADARTGDQLVAPEHVCPNPALSASARTQVHAMLCYHQYARRRMGLSVLRRASPLSRSAALKARLISRCGQFTHTPCGHSFQSVFNDVGYIRNTWAIGENLGWGSGRRGGVREMFIGWLRSPGHREDIIRSDWRDIGIARIHLIRMFGYGDVTIWVTHFGSH